MSTYIVYISFTFTIVTGIMLVILSNIERKDLSESLQKYDEVINHKDNF